MDKEFLHLMDSVSELIPEAPGKLDDETLICECFCVSAADIRSLGGPDVELEKCRTTFALGTGCQTCVKNIDSWMNKIF